MADDLQVPPERCLFFRSTKLKREEISLCNVMDCLRCCWQSWAYVVTRWRSQVRGPIRAPRSRAARAAIVRVRTATGYFVPATYANAASAAVRRLPPPRRQALRLKSRRSRSRRAVRSERRRKPVRWLVQRAAAKARPASRSKPGADASFALVPTATANIARVPSASVSVVHVFGNRYRA